MKIGLSVFSVFTFLVLVSCVSIQDRMLPPDERISAEIVGRVEVKFISAQLLHIKFDDAIAKKAYAKLMEEARRKYQGNIEVVNITADGNFNPLTLLPIFIYGAIVNFQTIKATGDVILYSGAVSTGRINQEKMGNILSTVTKTLTDRLPDNSTIAVLSISSPNKNDSEFIIDELEFRLVNSGKFSIVDRRRLDQIRNELNFQMSGDVDDNSAISIGNMLGANIVLTGNITGGPTQYLNIKALDVKTARIIAMAREQL